MSASKKTEFKKVISTGTLQEINLKLNENISLLNQTFGSETFSALHQVINNRTSDCLQVLKHLIDAGINCNLKDIYGNTSLLFAAKLSKLEVAGYLVNKCDITVQNSNGLNIIHMLASRGGLNAVMGSNESGLKCNTDIQLKELINRKTFSNMSYQKEFDSLQKGKGNTVIVNGWYPLHYAALSCDLESVNWLINHGAEVNRPNSDLVNARELLEKYNNQLASSKLEQQSKKIIGKLTVGRPIHHPKTQKETCKEKKKQHAKSQNEDSEGSDYRDKSDDDYSSDDCYSDDFETGESDDSCSTSTMMPSVNVKCNGKADTGLKTSRSCVSIASSERGVQTSRMSNRSSTSGYSRVRTPADGGERHETPSKVDLEESRRTLYPADKLLADIALEIAPTDYKFFGIYLEIEVPFLEALSISKINTAERTLDLLLHWRNSCRLTEKEKKECLIVALRKIKKNDIVYNFLEERGTVDGDEIHENQSFGNMTRQPTMVLEDSETKLTKYPPDKTLATIARKIAPLDYKFFGIHLGIESHVIDALAASKVNTAERTLDLLLHWRNDCRLNNKQKNEHLIEALRGIHKNNIVQLIFKDRGYTPKNESRFS